MARTGKNNGFTLVEIMVAMALMAIIAASVYKTFASQQQVYVIQGQSVDLQQGLRAAVDMMTRELKMAGFDPLGRSGATVSSANSTSVHFSMDLNGNGKCCDSNGKNCDGNEDVTYLLDDSEGNKTLRRKSGAGSKQTIAENVENMEFWYTINNNGVIANTHTPPEPDKIEAVEINLLLRTENKDKGFTDTTIYHTTHAEGSYAGVDWGPYNDGFRRRLASTVVRCRNMELKQ